MAGNIDTKNFPVGDLRDIEDVDDAPDAKTVLRRWLSTRSVLTTASIHEDEAALNLDAFRAIGKGFCGEVFEKIGSSKVYKRALRPQENQLWNDYLFHINVYNKITGTQLLHGEGINPALHVARVFGYLTREDDHFWNSNIETWSKISSRERPDLLETELIPPLPPIVRKSLIILYCPPRLDKEQAFQDPLNEHCLIRVYLGTRRSQRSMQSFSLRNFEVDLSIFDELCLEKEEHAEEMAKALAIMHWACKIDANDVEFVLGPAAATGRQLTLEQIAKLPPRTSSAASLQKKGKRAVQLWLLDFNNCSPITMDEEGVKKAVRSFYSNDPYYPRPVASNDPGRQLWEHFKACYLTQSAISASQDVREKRLPELFIGNVGKIASTSSSKSTSGPPRTYTIRLPYSNFTVSNQLGN
jgi:hypothetical protein